MAEVIHGIDEIRVVPKEELLLAVMTMKNENRRLAQACAAYVNGLVEVSYTFADDEAYQLVHLRVVINPDDSIPSITPFFPIAVFYENEMSELYGLRIDMMEGIDYHGRLYRIEKEAPFRPEVKK